MRILLTRTTRALAPIALAAFAASFAQAQSLGTQSITVGGAATSSSVLLSTSSAWTATANDSWLHITGSTSGTGNAVVYFSADALSGAGSRNGTLTVAGLNLSVTQLGTNYAPVSPLKTISSGLNVPNGVAVDSAGNLYIADTNNNAIKLWTASTGTVSTLVSGLNGPHSVALDTAGNVYFSDTYNSAIKKYTASTQSVSVFVSNAAAPRGIALDPSGNVYYIERNSQSIKKWTASTQAVSTVTTGLNTSGNFLARDLHGNLYATDGNAGTIQKWTASSNTLSTLVSLTGGAPTGIAIDGSGNVIFADLANSIIYQWTAASQQVTTLKPSVAATGIALDTSGNLFSANSSNGTLYKINFGYQTLGTNAVTVGNAAGTGTLQLGYLPYNSTAPWIAASSSSWLHVPSSGTGGSLVTFTYDANNSGATRTGTVTFDGGGALVVTQAKSGYVSSNTGLVAIASSGLSGPHGVAVDRSGNVFFTDRLNGQLKKWTASTQTVSTLVSGLGEPDQIAVDGAGNVFIANADFGEIKKWDASTLQTSTILSNLQLPFGIAVDPLGNVYYADSSDKAVRKWNAGTQQVTTLISTGLSDPEALAVDTLGNIYVADYIGATIQKWSPITQTVTTVASTGLFTPACVAVDGGGNLYIADTGGNRLALWAASTQALSTLIDQVAQSGIALDTLGNVFVASPITNTVSGAIFAQVPSASFSKTAASGSDQAGPVLPLGTPLNGVFAPTSDQSWLTIGSVANGVTNFSYSANVDGVRTGHVSLVGLPVTVSQATPVSGLILNAGNGQSAAVNQAFATNLQLKVTDSGSNPVTGTHVTFTIHAGSGGTSGAFAASPAQPIATLADGIATAPVLTANGIAGTFTVTATAGDSSSTFTLTVTKAAQTINFGALSNATLGSTPAALSATASSGLTVSFASTTSAVCTVSGTAITLVSVGSCSIQATQAGNTTYAAATPVIQTFQVLQGAQTITFAALAGKTFGNAPFPVSATASSGLAVTFSVPTTTAVCTISGSTVTIVGAGACSIQADQAGNANYTAASAVTQSFTVAVASQTITFAQPSAQTVSSTPLTVPVSASSGLQVTLTSNTTSVCTVNPDRTVALAAVGSCSLTASQTGDANYSAATSVTRTFSVAQGSQTVTFAALTDRVFGSGSFAVSATASSGLAVTFSSITTPVCSVSGSTVTLVAAGACTILAAQAGNTNYAAATPVSQSFQVSQASQTITFPALTNKPFGTAPFNVSATASSGLAVGFSSQTAAVCTVSGSTVTLVSAGTCTLQATQAGDTNWSAATPVSQSFQVSQASQTITFAAIADRAFGSGAFTVSATASSSLAVSFSSTTPAVCAVSGSTVTLVTAGACTIQAAQAGNTNYAAATPVSQSFQVSQASQTISFAALTNKPFGTAPFTVSATASSGLAVGFNSQTATVCTVSGSTVTLLTAGACTLQATQAGDTNWSAATPVSQSFQVSQASQTITFAAIADRAFNSGSFPLTATATSGLAVGFASATTGVCTVSGTTVTLAAAGACTIQATQAGDTNFAAAPVVNQTFNVIKANQSITFAALANQTLGSAPFSVTATATSALPATFSSTTTGVCTVSGATVTPVASGVCTVRAAQAGDSNWNAAANVDQSFTVTQGTQTITFAPLADRTFGAGTFTLSATASSGLAVSFASTTTPVCTVAGSTVTLASAGACTIQATQGGNASYAAATPVNQTFNVTAAAQTITFAALSNRALNAGAFTLSATASSGLTVSFTSTTPSVCSVSGITATPIAAGTCGIQASQTGNASYSAATPVSQSFQVTAGTQTITFGALSNQALTAGAITVSATASSSLSVSFNSQTTAVCTVSGSTVTLLAAGTCTVQATQAGDANWSAAAPVNQSFLVSIGTQTITFGTLSNRVFGAAPFAVSATASSGLPVSFGSQTTSVCTVSGSTVTLLAAGACTIRATQAGNANYAAATPVDQSFSVTTGTQTITFGTLSNQVFGAAPFTVSATASSGLPVSFGSQTTSVCTVSGSTVTLVASGACTIRATQAGNTNYAAATPVDQSFSVTTGTQTITFGALSNQVFGAAPFAVSATASSGLPVSFGSQTTSVCTVSGSTVTLVAAGACTIRATQAGNTNYAAATPVDQTFNVTAAAQTITFGALADRALGSAPFAVSATASSGLPVTFASQTAAVCTVSGTTVTLAAVGQCTIQAVQAGNASYAAASPVSQSFAVTQGVQTITFGALSSRALSAGAFNLSATASSGLSVSFASSTPSICSVSGTTATALAVGVCTVQASQAGNANYAAAAPVNQSFQVTSGVQTINFGALSSQVYGTAPFTVSATASSGLPVSFTSQTTAVCTVSGTTVTLAAGGACTIQATQPGDANYSAATPVNQSFTVTAGSQTITFGTLGNQVLGATPFALAATASSGLPVSFASQTTPVCTVSGATVTLVSAGACTIQATQAGNASYVAATPVNQSFQVTPGQYLLTTLVAPNSAAGSISPSTGVVSGGAAVPVRATANPGYVFTGFSGGLTGATNPQSVTLNGALTVTANFAPLPDLSIGLTHTGAHFSQGQLNATYQITVSNSGPGASSGPVSVTNTLPAGLSLVSMIGTGWTCGAPNAANVCTRSDSAGAGATYPAITLTVKVDPAAPATAVSTVNLSAAGDFNASNDAANDVVSINPITILSSTQVSVTQTGFVRNRTTGVFSATLTLTNTSSTPIAGPIGIVFANLTSNVTMVNNAGVRNGSPYTVVTPNSLAAGASVSVPIQFLDPTNVTINFVPVVFSGVF